MDRLYEAVGRGGGGVVVKGRKVRGFSGDFYGVWRWYWG